MAEVVLERITKRFGELTAVEDVSIAVQDGEFFVLLGATGAGKTTTLRVVAGLERPEGGKVLIGGQDMTQAAPAARDVAFVFQQYSLYPHYSVYDNLAFPLRSPLRRRSESEVRARVEEVAGLLRIGDKLANRATELSGGEMQRVSIGRALVRAPSVFLMDEPLSSLDAKLRDELRIELKRVQLDLGATILYVTHDQVEALTLADRVGVLSEGRVIQIGAPAAIYRDPDSLFVARQLGSPPINVLPAGILGLAAPDPLVSQIAVRPEDVTLEPAGRTGSRGVTVVQIERFGAEDVILVEAEGQRVHVISRPGSSIAVGDRIALRFREDALLCFDAAGQRVRLTGGPGRATENTEMTHVG